MGDPSAPVGEALPEYRGFPGWDAWSRPTHLTLGQSALMSKRLTAMGKCGAVTPTDHVGFACCSSGEGECRQEGYHCDGRHQVVWDFKGPEALELIDTEGVHHAD